MHAKSNEKFQVSPSILLFYQIHTQKQDNNANNHAASSHNRQELINQPKNIF